MFDESYEFIIIVVVSLISHVVFNIGLFALSNPRDEKKEYSATMAQLIPAIWLPSPPPSSLEDNRKFSDLAHFDTLPRFLLLLLIHVFATNTHCGIKFWILGLRTFFSRTF